MTRRIPPVARLVTAGLVVIGAISAGPAPSYAASSPKALNAAVRLQVGAAASGTTNMVWIRTKATNVCVRLTDNLDSVTRRNGQVRITRSHVSLKGLKAMVFDSRDNVTAQKRLNIPTTRSNGTYTRVAPTCFRVSQGATAIVFAKQPTGRVHVQVTGNADVFAV